MTQLFPFIFFILGFLVELLNISSRREQKKRDGDSKQNVRGLILVPFCFYIVGIAFYELPTSTYKVWWAVSALSFHLICYFVIPFIFRKKPDIT